MNYIIVHIENERIKVLEVLGFFIPLPFSFSVLLNTFMRRGSVYASPHKFIFMEINT